MNVVGSLFVSPSLMNSQEYLMISLRASRQYTIVGLSLLASILASTFLNEKLIAGGGIGSPQLKCIEEPTDSSKCAYGGSLGCPPTQPPTTGLSFFCSTFHVPKLCTDSPNSTCVVRNDLLGCGNKKDCYNNQDVMDAFGNIVKCNQFPKDCT